MLIRSKNNRYTYFCNSALISVMFLALIVKTQKTSKLLSSTEYKNFQLSV